jgi:hypothetical protein
LPKLSLLPREEPAHTIGPLGQERSSTGWNLPRRCAPPPVDTCFRKEPLRDLTPDARDCFQTNKAGTRYLDMPESDVQVVGPRVGYFITPHGFGHAARAAAVMAAIHEINHSVHFHIFTKVPSWVFMDSLSGPFTYHSLLTDIGIVQETALDGNLSETCRKLNDFLPFRSSRVSKLSRLVRELRCELIICDIAPMGIEVAREADITSVLVENFTWDWIYHEYVSEHIDMNTHIKYLKNISHAVNYHIQTEPLCGDREAHLVTKPVSRKIRTHREEIRQKIGLPGASKVVLITMGGIQDRYPFLEKLTEEKDIFFLIPGASEIKKVMNNLVLLPHHSEFFHPDLINASDAVIGKVGYSTLAEAYHAGIPFGYISRKSFRESKVLEDFISREMNGFSIEREEFEAGRWRSRLPELLSFPRLNRKDQNGAEEIAQFIIRLLNEPG